MDTPLVIKIVGAVLFLSVLGVVLLSFGFGGGRPIPDVLQNVTVGSLTALVGLLVPTRGGPGGPTAP